MIYDPSKYFKVFTAGKYPQGEITVAMLSEVASNYDTSFKKSPVTIDHQDGISYGWISDVMLKDKDLFVSFDEITEDGLELNQSGKYRYPSCEFVDYDGKGLYLRALTMTNFNQVKNLPQLQFNDKNELVSEDASFFTTENISINFNKPSFFKTFKEEKMLSQLIKTFAEKLNINVTEYNSDIAVIDKAAQIVNGLQTDLAAKSEQVQSLTLQVSKFNEKNPDVAKMHDLETEVAALKEKNQQLESKRSADLVDAAITAGKILPAMKDKFIKFAETDYDLAKATLDNMGVQKIFDDKTVPTKDIKVPVLFTDDKFKNPDGSEMTYKQFCDKSTDDPKFADNFSSEEIAALRAKYKDS